MRKILIMILAVLVLSSCSPSKEDKMKDSGTKPTEVAKSKDGNTEANAIDDNKTSDVTIKAENIESNPKEHSKDAETIDLSLKPNEGGKVMILMYHNIGPEEEEWVRTPDNFRKDLEVLYEKGYVPIRLVDYAAGKIDIPAGKTPFILTFDDARQNNFSYLPDGSIDPDCALGILLEFGKKHPDIVPHCSFFANGDIPFKVKGEEQKKVRFLVENGMDLGNHSVNHPDLTKMTAKEVEYEIGAQAEYLTELLDTDYKINTLALPFGSRPDDPEVEKFLFSGEYEGFHYENLAVLNVGWDPDLSPYHVNFDPLQLHRIRASETDVDNVGIYNWLEYFDDNPEERYISDGNKHFLTVPHDMADTVKVPESMELMTY